MPPAYRDHMEVPLPIILVVEGGALATTSMRFLSNLYYNLNQILIGLNKMYQEEHDPGSAPAHHCGSGVPLATISMTF